MAFAPLPRLCVGSCVSQPGGVQAELHLFERNTLDEIVAFDLLRADPRPALEGFRLVEQRDLFEIYINEQRLELRQARDAAQLSLDAVPTDANETDLVLWLTTALRRPTLTDETLRRWMAVLVAQLRQGQGLSLTGLLRARHALVQAALRRLDELQARARRQGFKQLTLLASATGGEAWAMGLSPDWQFRYLPGRYPARHRAGLGTRQRRARAVRDGRETSGRAGHDGAIAARGDFATAGGGLTAGASNLAQGLRSTELLVSLLGPGQEICAVPRGRAVCPEAAPPACGTHPLIIR